jgi:hypothetical protein
VEEVMLALLCAVRRKLVPAGTDTEAVQSSGAKADTAAVGAPAARRPVLV